MALRFRKPERKHIGFYLALGACMIAIGASAWTTFDSIQSLRKPVSASSARPVQQTVSDVPASRPSVSSASPSSAVTSSKATSARSSVPTSSATASVPSLPSSSTVPVVSKPTRSVTPTYILPINGPIQKHFGASLYSRTFCDWRAHNGIDITGAVGCNVLAMGDGTVTEFRTDPMLGGVLIIQHGNWTAWYCGLGDNPAVHSGDTVHGGQVLGILKDVPSETVEDAHLHLQIQKDGQWVEPLAVLGKTDLLPKSENG